MFAASLPSIPLNLPALQNQQVGATVLMSQCTQLPASLLLSGSLAWFLDQEGTLLCHTALSTTFLSYCCPIPMNIRQLLWQILTNFWRRFQSEYSEIHRRKNLEPLVTQPSLQKFSGHWPSLSGGLCLAPDSHGSCLTLLHLHSFSRYSEFLFIHRILKFTHFILYKFSSVLSWPHLPTCGQRTMLFFFFVQKSIKRYEGFYLFKKIYALKGNNTIFYQATSPITLFFSFYYNPHTSMHIDLAECVYYTYIHAFHRLYFPYFLYVKYVRNR